MNEDERRSSWYLWLACSMNQLDRWHGRPWWDGLPAELTGAVLIAANRLDIDEGTAPEPLRQNIEPLIRDPRPFGLPFT